MPVDLKTGAGLKVRVVQENLSSIPGSTEPWGFYGVNTDPEEADLLFGIEKVLLTSFSDTVIFSNKTFDGGVFGSVGPLKIDGGLESDSKSFDEVKLGDGLSKVTVDLRDKAKQFALEESTGLRVELKNFEVAFGGKGNDTLYAVNLKDNVLGADPLVLDLGNDGLTSEGLDLTGLELTSPRFDIKALVPGDGFGDDTSVRTGWIEAGTLGVEALLARDIEALVPGDGKITSVAAPLSGELFGTIDTSGFAELSELDTLAEGGNEDGFITIEALVPDAGFGDLLLWVDANQDALTDLGELNALADFGVFELSLATEDPTPENANIGTSAGNEVTAVSTFRREIVAPTGGDGSVTITSGLLADVSFVYESAGLKTITADVCRDGRYFGLLGGKSDYVAASQ